MLTQLNPPLPLETPKGEGMAYAVIDYGPDFDLLWVVFDDASGECWTWPNPKVRAVKNISLGHRATETMRPRPVAGTNGAFAKNSENGNGHAMNGQSNGNGINGHSAGNHVSRLTDPAAP